MKQLTQIFKSSNENDLAVVIKEEWKTVYYPSSKTVQDGIEKSMA